MHATYELNADRLTDALNGDPSVDLTDVEVITLDAPATTTLAQLRISRDELLIVEAAGPRGDGRRRLRAAPHAVSVKLGPYRVLGFLHSPPGAHPILGLYHRRPMVPMTEVEIFYEVLGRPIIDRYSAAIINREAVAAVESQSD